jgi:ribonucleotide monophosphatase NagD (HAD superfamily)
MAAAAQPALKLSSKERAQLFAEHLVMLNLGKSCYKRADLLLELLASQPDRHKPVKLTKRSLGRKAIAAKLREAQKLVVATIVGKPFSIADKFAKRNSIPVGQNARRFEVEEVSTL